MKKKLKTSCLVLFVSTLFIQAQQGLSTTRNLDVDSQKSSNRIAVAAVGDSVTSEISTVAGRAPYYLIFDGNCTFLKSIKNPSLNKKGGASSVVINLLIEESVNIVIAGKFGDKMKIQLKANKIEYHERDGIANVIVKSFIKKIE